MAARTTQVAIQTTATAGQSRATSIAISLLCDPYAEPKGFPIGGGPILTAPVRNHKIMISGTRRIRRPQR